MSLLLLLQVRYTIVQMDYLANKDYISSVLCIEKDLPKSSCEGKCQLRKELAKLEDVQDDRQNVPVRVSIVPVEFIADGMTAILIDPSETQVSRKIYHYSGVIKLGIIEVDLPPPESIV